MATKPAEKPLKPRKAPRQKRAAATIETILEAAARILERDGFAGYNTNAVAERAGVSIGSLYQYFPGKDAMTAALIERETATLLSEIGEVAQAPDWEAALRQLITAAVAHQMRRPILARLLDFEERRLPVGERHDRVNDRVERDLIGILRRPDAKLADAKPGGVMEILAADLMALIRGIVDAAGERGETDATDLQHRVERAAFGYLDRCRA